MNTQMYQCGAAKTVSQMDLKPNQDMSVKLVTVAIHPPLKWRVICSRRREVALIPNRIRCSIPSFLTRTPWTDHEHYANARFPTKMRTTTFQDQQSANEESQVTKLTKTTQRSKTRLQLLDSTAQKTLARHDHARADHNVTSRTAGKACVSYHRAMTLVALSLALP